MKTNSTSPATPARFIAAGLAAGILFGIAPVLTANAFSVIPPTFAELVAESGRIVRARVTAVEAFRTVSPTGHPLIKTRVTWKIDDVLKGSDTDTMTLEFLGGRIGDEALTVGGMPEFRVGDRDFLFVEPNEKVICPLIAAGHGRYPIVADTVTGTLEVRRSNGLALTQTGRVADSLDEPAPATAARALTPEEFESAIRAALAGTSSSNAY